jgi:uncharacterized repeat protein (TIGR03803 family)
MTTDGGDIVTSTVRGPHYQGGAIFQYNLTTNTETLLHSFGAAGDGATPDGSLIQVGSALYGMTSGGGSNGEGAIIKYDIATGDESVLHSFAGGMSDGSPPPYNSLVDSGSVLYGTTISGGAHGLGTIFDYDLTTNTENILYSFGTNSNDGGCDGSLILSGSTLYGMGGGIFAFNLNTDTETILHTFAGGTTDGDDPYGSLLLSGSTLYGMTYQGGANNTGIIFSLTVPEPASASLLAISCIALLARKHRPSNKERN